MSDEIESKVRVTDHEPVQAKLRAAGAQYEGRALETNRLFDDAQRALYHAGCGLRIRECQTLDGPPRRATLTYKGPPRPGRYKHRTEIEVHIEDARAMIEILAALGFSEHFAFEKKRESWKMGPCSIELDELPQIGRFVEVEGPSEEAIQTTLTSLGLADSEILHESYAALLTKGNPDHPAIFRFSD